MYAVLLQCLVLDINTLQYLFNSESPLNAMQTMHELIANHMCVCVVVGARIESLCSIVASSDLILLEAVSHVMLSEKFCLHLMLLLVLTGFSINQGDCGELLVAAFFAWACDQAIHEKLPQFCSYFSAQELYSLLFSNSTFQSILGSLPSLSHTDTEQPFRDIFANANMHFNHMIKPRYKCLWHVDSYSITWCVVLPLWVPTVNPDLMQCFHSCSTPSSTSTSKNSVS